MKQFMYFPNLSSPVILTHLKKQFIFNLFNTCSKFDSYFNEIFSEFIGIFELLLIFKISTFC